MSDSSKQSCSVLFLDDNQDDRYFFHRAVARTQTPFIIHAFYASAPAVAYLQNEWPFHETVPHAFPRLIVCDWDLGDSVKGCEIVETVRHLPCCPTLPIIMLSATSDPDSVLRCYDAGANAFIQKSTFPRRWEALVQCLYESVNDLDGDLSRLAEFPEYQPPARPTPVLRVF